ncbi:MAG: glycoside hydrolase family 43 protein [Bacteroidia bacterium]
MFYLITTCVQCEKGGNFYITAENPAGPWFDPVWLDSPGIDPSLMWDDDGKCYYVGHENLQENQDWKDQQGVWLQELDTKQGRLVGDRKQLTFGHASNAAWIEGPHLYKINNKYLLMVAEGGTGILHATTVHHADAVFGPYTADYVNPVLTHRHLGQDYPIHSIGHTDLIETQNGEWWAVMLGKRYVDGYTLLARETFLCPVSFDGQTPVFNRGKGMVETEMQRPDLPWTPVEATPARDDFDSGNLSLVWNMLRTPQDQWYTLQKGNLTLNLRPNILDSLTNPSLLARRIQHHDFEASCSMHFASRKTNEKAGMIIYRRSGCHFQLLKEKDELVIIQTMVEEKTEIAQVKYNSAHVILKARGNGRALMFSYGTSENDIKPLGAVLDMQVVSHEVAQGFNGPYVGVYATSRGEDSDATASFDWFEYLGQ